MRRCPHCAAKSLKLLQFVRSTKDRPLRCGQCGKFSCTPHWFSLLVGLTLEVSVWSGLLLALWFKSGYIFIALLALAGAAILAMVAVCPLLLVTKEPGKLSFGGPGPFYSDTP